MEDRDVERSARSKATDRQQTAAKNKIDDMLMSLARNKESGPQEADGGDLEDQDLVHPEMGGAPKQLGLSN